MAGTAYDEAGNLTNTHLNEALVYDAFGKLAAEYTDASAPTPGTFYRTVDHLGSTRLVTDGLGVPAENTDSLPFGEEILVSSGDTRYGIAAYGSTGLLRHKFTGKERDSETGLDYFGARYYSGPIGRFLSADPAQITVETAAVPQKWNRYADTRNNPLLFIDPVGYPFHSGSPNILWSASGRFVVPICHERAVRSGLDGDGLLNEPVEELTAAA